MLSGVSVTPTVAGAGLTFIVTGSTKTGTATFTVNPGTLDHFAISTITSPQTAGTPITGITLTAQDVNNNTVTSFTTTVAYSGTAGITGTSLAFTAGVLSSVSVTPTVAGAGLTFVVTGSTKTGTATFTVNPGTPTQLVWTQQPSAVFVGATMSPAVTVAVEDAWGNVATTASGTVTLALTTPGGATLTGGDLVPVSSGVATFSSLSIDKYAAGYTLTPTTTVSGVTTLPVSQSFTVTLIAVYVTNRGSNSVSVVNGATNTVMSTISDLKTPYAVAIDSVHAFAYVSLIDARDDGNDSVAVINIATGSVARRVEAGNKPKGVAISPGSDPAYIFVANSSDGTMSAIHVDNPAFSTFRGPWAGATSPGDLVALPDHVWIVMSGSNSVFRYDHATGTGTVSVPVGTDPYGIAANGRYLYVTNYGGGTGNTVSVIDTTTSSVTSTVTGVGLGPAGIAITPDGTRAYVANNAAGTVSVIRTSDNEVVGGPITVGSGPNGVAVSLAGDYVYVANIGSGTVSVIATATNTVVQTVTVGTNPFNVAVVRLPTP